MAGFAEWQMEPAVAAGLEHLGWRADEPGVRDVVPAVLRGGNVVAVVPPLPAYASPLIAALLGRQPAPERAVLILCAPAQIGEWAVTLGALVEGTALRVEVVRELMEVPGRATVQADVVVASPETALERHSLSAFHPERFGAVLFAWPESWHADDAVAAILQDLPRDAQRVVLTARADAVDGSGGLIERFARRALVIGGGAVEPSPTAAPRTLSVRSVPVAWTARAATTAAVVDALNAPSATIWTADLRDHQAIQRALGSLRPGLALAARSAPVAGAVVCYDLPTAAQLAGWSAVGDVVLLVPPGCEEFAARLAPARRPMSVGSASRAVADRDAALRRQIGEAITSGDPSAALYALAPLFESFDPQAVAAALFGLWQSRPVAPAPRPPAVAFVPPVQSTGGAIAKIWIGAGKKDEATVADFVAVLVREVGVERAHIGRIELRDTFALVEVPAADAAAIVERLSGITIRKRKLTARLDQGRGAPKRS